MLLDLFASKKCQAAAGKRQSSKPTHKHQVDLLRGHLSMDVAASKSPVMQLLIVSTTVGGQTPRELNFSNFPLSNSFPKDKLPVKFLAHKIVR